MVAHGLRAERRRTGAFAFAGPTVYGASSGYQYAVRGIYTFRRRPGTLRHHVL